MLVTQDSFTDLPLFHSLRHVLTLLHFRFQKTESWSEALIGLDEDSDASSCDDEGDIIGVYEQEDLFAAHVSSEIDNNELENIVIQPGPKRPVVFSQIVESMPRLERMKHCPTLESIAEEDASGTIHKTLQAMDTIPIAMQTIQVLTVSMDNTDNVVLPVAAVGASSQLPQPA